MKGGDEEQFHDGSLYKVGEPILKRRDVYGLMIKKCDIVMKTLRKEEKQ
jgi:hypothetical protein